MNTDINNNNDQHQHSNNSSYREEDILRILGEDDGIRMTKLKMFFELLIENSINEFTLTKLEECFSDIDVKSIQSILSILHKTVRQTLSDNINNEFFEICKKRHIAAILSQIDQLIREQPILDDGKRSPMLGLEDPNHLITSQVSQIKQNEYDRLTLIYKNLSEENEKLTKISSDLENEKTIVINNINAKVKSVNDLIKASVHLEQ